MRLPRSSTRLLLNTTIFSSTVRAILVAPSSPCAVQCGNVLSATTPNDLVCGDSSYSASTTGQSLQNCISCELNSTYYDPNSKQTDLQWLLYNLRYSISYCLFGYPNNTNIASSPCITRFACGSLEDAVSYNLNLSNATEFGYCSQWAYDQLPRCEACLTASNAYVLANFVTALTAACQQLPPAGSKVSIDGGYGGLFQHNLVNITSPVNTSIPVYTPPPAGALSLGGKVGIALGGLVALLILTGCTIVCVGKRRRRAHLRRLAEKNQSLMQHSEPVPRWKEYSSPGSESNKAFMPPGNQHWPVSAVDDSPQSSREGDYVFSPYQSTYTSPVSPMNSAGAAAMPLAPGQFAPVPIPLPYDLNTRTRRGSEVSTPGSAGGGNAIEMNQIRRTSSMASSIAARNARMAPVIREPVPVLVRMSSKSLPLRAAMEQAEAREREREDLKGRGVAHVHESEDVERDGAASPPGMAL